MPAVGWNGTLNSGGTPAAFDENLARTYGGKTWPDQPIVAANIDRYMTIEATGGWRLFVALTIGHRDGFDPCMIECEGTILTQTPFLAGFTSGGVPQWGLWADLQARPGTRSTSIANVTITAYPKRGYPRRYSCPVWLNDDLGTTRPQFWVDPAATDNSGAGSFASPWRDPSYAEYAPGVAYSAPVNAANLASGWRIMCKTASNAYRLNRGAVGNSAGDGPVTWHLGPGLVPGDVVMKATGFLDAPSGDRINFRAKREELWGIKIDTADVRGINYFGTAANDGCFYYRDDCLVIDGPGAAGPLDNDYPAGTAASATVASGKSHRLHDPDDNYARIGVIGSPGHPARFEVTHWSGLNMSWYGDVKLGWAGPFPRGDSRDSNFRIMNTTVKGHGNFWFRDHLAVTGTITAVSAVTINGVALWRLTTDLTDLPNYPPLASGGTDLVSKSTLPHKGATWALLFGSGTPAWGGGENWLGTLGPEHPTNRDGTQDFPGLGWPIYGYETAGKYVYLRVTDATGLSTIVPNTTQIRCQFNHGCDMIFWVAEQPNIGHAENFCIYNSVLEHPEAYMLLQHGGLDGAGSGTVSYNSTTGVLTFSTAQSKMAKGYAVTIDTAGANLNKTAIVRKVLSSTTAEIYGTIDGNFDEQPTFSGSFSGLSFSMNRTIIGAGIINSFMWCNSAQSQMGKGAFTGWVWDSSSVALHSDLYASDIFFYQDQADRPTTFMNSFAVKDSYVADLSVASGSWPTIGFAADHNQYGRNTGRDTIGSNVVSLADFTASLAGTGVTVLVGANPQPVDINGVARTASVSKVGAKV